MLGAAAGIALTLFALWPTVRGLVTTWSVSDSYRYGWLVVPTLVYLLGWHHRALLLSLVPRPGFAGVLVAALATVLWGVSELMNVDVGRQLALVLALQGVAMAALGWRVYWRLFPMLALLFLAIPSGDILLAPLRRLTLESIVWFADMAGMSPRVDGYVIAIGQGSYIVIDECAGLTFVTLGLFLGYSLGLMLYPSFVKAAALALAGAALAIVSNVVRVNAIVLIDWLRGSHMDLTAHSRFQTFALVLGIVLLFLVFYRLAGAARPAPAKDVPGENTGRACDAAPVRAGARRHRRVAGCQRIGADGRSRSAAGILPCGARFPAGQPARLEVRRCADRLGGRCAASVAYPFVPHTLRVTAKSRPWWSKPVRRRRNCRVPCRSPENQASGVKSWCRRASCAPPMAASSCGKSTWTSTGSGDHRHMVYAYQLGPVQHPIGSGAARLAWLAPAHGPGRIERAWWA